MKKQELIINFNQILLDLLDNFSGNFPGLYKYRAMVYFNNTDKWITDFSKNNITTRKELFESPVLNDIGMSILDLTDRHKKIIWSYFEVLIQLRTKYNIAK